MFLQFFFPPQEPGCNYTACDTAALVAHQVTVHEKSYRSRDDEDIALDLTGENNNVENNHR